MIKTAVILAAGRGRRLDDAGHAFSKPLVRLGAHTMLARVISCCRKAGITKIVLVTGFRRQLVEQEARRHDRGDIETVYNPDWERSNGLSLYACREAVPEEFLLTMVDHLFDVTIMTDLAALPLRPNSAVLAVDRKVQHIYDLADATKVRTEGDRISAIGKQIEPFDAIDCGLFACTSAIFLALEEAMVDGDCSLSAGMQVLGGRERFYHFDIGARLWQDVDTPDMFHAAEALLRRPEFAIS